ncbi:MAG: SRPBCC domain-containing protein [Bacteroidota bacterium]
METEQKTKITVETFVQAPKNVAWKLRTTPEDIVHWNNASDDWHTLNAKIDLRTGGEFLYRMEAKDGSFGFDFGGVFDTVRPKEFIAYTIGDGRKVEINFIGNGSITKIAETFEAESQNPIEMQRDGWQAILNNFKKYSESRSRQN